MTIPLRITFRDMTPSPALAALVEQRASKLEIVFDRLVDCHVVLEEPHRRKRKGKKFHVRIELRVPTKEIVVSRTPENTKEDLYAAVDVAFNDAERLLDDHAQRIHRSTQATVHSRPPHGVIAKVFHERGYGFIEADNDGHEVYFHRNSVLDARFDKLEAGTKVRYAEEDGDKGPQASTVHVVHAHA